jgi:hypothetical protein
MSRISSIVARGSGDVLRERDRRRQNRRNPARCQRRTVSGWTRTMTRRHDGNHRAPRSSFSRSTTSSLGRLQPRRNTLTWWRSTAFSSTSSRRDRTASMATAAISLACLRGANCDHSRSMRARNQVRMREALGKRIRHLEHKR